MQKGLRILKLFLILILILKSNLLYATTPNQITDKSKLNSTKNNQTLKNNKKNSITKKNKPINNNTKQNSSINYSAINNIKKDKTDSSETLNTENKNNKVYDLGNIVVQGEDKTKIKDKTKKSTNYIIKDANNTKYVKKETANFKVIPKNDQNNDKVKRHKFSTNISVGNESFSNVNLRYETNNLNQDKKILQSVQFETEKSDGYRYKSDYHQVLTTYKFKIQKDDEVNNDVNLSYSYFNGNLPGFNNFINNYTNVTINDFKIGSIFNQKFQNIKINFKKFTNEFNINQTNISENYNLTNFNLNYNKDLDTRLTSNLILPLTLSLNFTNDFLDTQTLDNFTLYFLNFNINTEKALNDKTMFQVNPYVTKTKNHNAKVGGTMAFIFKNNIKSQTENSLNTKTIVTFGSNTKMYETYDLLTNDINSILWLKDNNGINRLSNAIEHHEKFVELGLQFDDNQKTNAMFKIKRSKNDELVYFSDLNFSDVRKVVNVFDDDTKMTEYKFNLTHILNENLKLTFDTVKRSMDELMPYIPKFENNLNLNYRHINGIAAKLNFKFKSEMDSSKNPLLNQKVDSYFVTNLYLDKNVINDGKLFIKVDNLFNNDLKIRPGYSYKDRIFALGFNYSYK